MRVVRFTVPVIASLLALACVTDVLPGQTSTTSQYRDELLGGLEWRDVGPMRGGRSYAVAGSPQQPDVFYMGSVGGGVWKTVNAGRTWFPVADQGIPIGSIGAIAVAPSDPKIVYVGTGEPDIRSQHSYGIGVFKSTDAGKTWKSVGLEDSRQIGRIVVDPTNPDLVYVAALGHVYDPNPTRGVYRSTDGGAHWKKVLNDPQRPNDVGAVELALDPANPRTVYASLWSTRRPPWSVYAPPNLPGGGLYKSTDGGDHWTKLSGGLPTDEFVGKIGIAVAPSNPNRLWAVVDDTGAAVAKPLRGGGGTTGGPSAQTGGGVYTSDDGGSSWKLVNSEQRLWGRGWYFESVAVDPVNPDRAYVINTGTYETTDGGKTFAPVKGSPGGDDDHQMWINPRDGNRMVLSTDQGTVVSVDGAQTWSTWYNQPTAQIYHVAASNDFPYHLYGAQQDSGGVGVDTWSPFGLLDFRDWEPTCLAGESNTVVPDPDPKHGRVLYGGGAAACDQSLNIALQPGGELPPADPDNPNRKTWTLPEVFSPADQALYYSNQFVFRTRDRGKTWQKISPDLTRLHPEVPKNLDALTATDVDQPMKERFGVVYTISPSPLDAKTVWVGTDDGLLQMTTDDGANWKDVTPPTMTTWSKVSQVEAGHFDQKTAYASIDRHRLGDMKPYILRTHDGGKTWTEVTRGIPDGAFVNSVKEDTRQKGLLYAATELRVYVSFDDGNHWQSLQGNMPVTSVRDLVVHGDDLAIATYGRGFWVLDQMSSLRQIAAEGHKIESAKVHLFAPGEALALRQGGMNGTPLPHEEPQELNPPSGVVAYYWLKSPATTPLKIELVDAHGVTRVCLASDTPVKPVDTEAINVQAIWEMQPPPPSAAAGTHRVSLDVRPTRGFGGGGFGAGGQRGGPQPPSDACHPPAAAAAVNNPPAPVPTQRRQRGAPGLQPGEYTVRLSVNGETFSQPATVKPDPRNIPDGGESTAFSANNNQ